MRGVESDPVPLLSAGGRIACANRAAVFLTSWPEGVRTRVTAIPDSGSPRAATRSTRHRPRRARRPTPAGLPPGVKEIRISSNENPLGPGKAALDAILGKFPEAGRYPFNSTPADSALVAAIATKFNVKPENIVLGAGSQEILKSAVRAFTSPTRGLVTALADVRELPGLRAASSGIRSPRSRSTRRSASTSRR